MQSPLGVKGLIVNRPMVEAEQNTREAWVRLCKEWLSLHDPTQTFFHFSTAMVLVTSMPHFTT